MRTTLFECNMQLYVVEFEIRGAKPAVHGMFEVSVERHSDPVLLMDEYRTKLKRVYSRAIEDAFLLKYTPRAVFQDIEKRTKS